MTHLLTGYTATTPHQRSRTIQIITPTAELSACADMEFTAWKHRELSESVNDPRAYYEQVQRSWATSQSSLTPALFAVAQRSEPPSGSTIPCQITSDTTVLHVNTAAVAGVLAWPRLVTRIAARVPHESMSPDWMSAASTNR